MATVPIKVPGFGESISEAILSRWLKPDGSQVQKGEPLYELETDKASNEVPAEANGVLKVQAQEGDTVEVGSTIGAIDPSGDGASASAAPAPEKKPKAEAAEAKPQPAEAEAKTESKAESKSADGSSSASSSPSPAVRRLAEEERVDLAQVDATGPGGRVTKGDVISHLESRGEEAKAAPSPSPTPDEAKVPPAPQPSASPATLQDRGPKETRQRMTGIRQRIAARLVEAQQTAAILTTFNEADMTRVMDMRAKYKESFQKKHGVNLGFMSFFVKACVEALKAFPAVNGRIEGNELVYHNYYDIGVAVSTERGLMVPVVRDCDVLDFAGIEQAIGNYGKKARENKIDVNDLQGGTFTITNGGIFGSMLSTPILNPPQSGILGMHSIQKRPVAIDDQVVIRPMMYLALSYDHRIIDGKEAVSFLVRVKECLENPERMMLDI